MEQNKVSNVSSSQGNKMLMNCEDQKMRHFYQTEANTTLRNAIPLLLNEDVHSGFVMSRHANQRMIERDLHKKALELVLIFGERAFPHMVVVLKSL